MSSSGRSPAKPRSCLKTATANIAEQLAYDEDEDLQEYLFPMESLREFFDVNKCVQIRQQQTKHLVAIQDSETPLETWLTYIAWAKKLFPGDDERLFHFAYQVINHCGVSLLEPEYKCYHDDPRYVNVWIECVTYAEENEAIETFRELMEEGVGKTVSNFYYAYATILEETGQLDQAENIYLLGLENEARPMRELAREFKEFKKRVREAGGVTGVMGVQGAIAAQQTAAAATTMPATTTAFASATATASATTASTTSTTAAATTAPVSAPAAVVEKRKADVTADISRDAAPPAKQARTESLPDSPKAALPASNPPPRAAVFTNCLPVSSTPFNPVFIAPTLTARLLQSTISTVPVGEGAQRSDAASFTARTAAGLRVGYDPSLLSASVGSRSVECCFRERKAMYWLRARMQAQSVADHAKPVAKPVLSTVTPSTTGPSDIGKSGNSGLIRPTEEKRSLRSMATPLKALKTPLKSMRTPSRSFARELQQQQQQQQQQLLQEQEHQRREEAEMQRQLQAEEEAAKKQEEARKERERERQEEAKEREREREREMKREAEVEKGRSRVSSLLSPIHPPTPTAPPNTATTTATGAAHTMSDSWHDDKNDNHADNLAKHDDDDDFAGNTALFNLDDLFAATTNFTRTHFPTTTTTANAVVASTSARAGTQTTVTHTAAGDKHTQKHVASPTINTRFAMEALDDIFAGTPQKKSNTIQKKSGGLQFSSLDADDSPVAASSSHASKPIPTGIITIATTTTTTTTKAGTSMGLGTGTGTSTGKAATSSSLSSAFDPADAAFSVEALTRKALASALPRNSGSSPLRLTGDSETTACIGAIFGSDPTTNFTTDETGDVTRMCMLEARMARKQQQQAASSINFYCDDEEEEEEDELAANTRANARAGTGAGTVGGFGQRGGLGNVGNSGNNPFLNNNNAGSALEAKRMSTIRSRFETTRKSVTGTALANNPARKSMTSRKSLMMGGNSGSGKPIDDEEFDRQQSQENQKFLSMFGNSGDFDDFPDFPDFAEPTSGNPGKKDTNNPFGGRGGGLYSDNDNSGISSKPKATSGGLKARGLSSKSSENALPTIAERPISGMYDEENMSSAPTPIPTRTHTTAPVPVPASAASTKPVRKGLGVLMDSTPSVQKPRDTLPPPQQQQQQRRLQNDYQDFMGENTPQDRENQRGRDRVSENAREREMDRENENAGMSRPSQQRKGLGQVFDTVATTPNNPSTVPSTTVTSSAIAYPAVTASATSSVVSVAHVGTSKVDTAAPLFPSRANRYSIASSTATSLFADDEEVDKGKSAERTDTAVTVAPVKSLMAATPQKKNSPGSSMELLNFSCPIDLHDAHLRHYTLLQALHALLSPNLEKNGNDRAMRTLYGNEAIRNSFNIPGIEGKRCIVESVSKHVIVNIIDDSKSKISSCPLYPRDLQQAYLSSVSDATNWESYTLNEDCGLALDLELDDTQYFFNTLFRYDACVPLHAIAALAVVSDPAHASGEVEHAKVTVGGLSALWETYIMAVLRQRLGTDECRKRLLMPREAGKSAYVYIHPQPDAATTTTTTTGAAGSGSGSGSGARGNGTGDMQLQFKQLPAEYEPLIENHVPGTKLSEEQALLRLRLCHSVGIANSEDDDVYEKPNSQLRLSVPSAAPYIDDNGVFTSNNALFGSSFATVITVQQQRSPVYTLFDVLKTHNLSKGTILTEPLLVYTTIEMLKCMTRAHSAGILHSSISAHSFQVKIPDANANSSWGDYTGKDTAKWDECGLLLSDWSHSTDLALVPQPFSGFKYNTRTYDTYCNPYYSTTDAAAEEDAAPEAETYMLRGGVSDTVKAWSKAMGAVSTKAVSQFVFEPDVYGVLSVLYAVLHNGCIETGNGLEMDYLVPPLEVVKTAGKVRPKNTEFAKVKPETSLHDLFIDVFDSLLNIPKFASDIPLDAYMREYVQSVTTVIAKLERYLTANPKMSAALKADICRQNTMLQM